MNQELNIGELRNAEDVKTMDKIGDDYKQSADILNRLTAEQREFIKNVVNGLPEKAAFMAVYRAQVGDWDGKAEPLFIITEEDAQIIAKDILNRELTPEEMHAVKKGVESGLDDWSMVVSVAVRYAAGQG